MRKRSRRLPGAFGLIGAQTECHVREPQAFPRGVRAVIIRALHHATGALTSTRGALEPMPRAPQRMPPVDAARLQLRGSHVVQKPVFLPQFVGEKKRNDEERNDQKDAQYQVLDHGGLRSQEHDFIVEHRAYPHRAAPRTIAPAALDPEPAAIRRLGVG